MSTPASEEVTLSLKEGEEPSDSENELKRKKRKMSSASVYSTDGGEDDDDDWKDGHVTLGPQLALKGPLEMEKDDESLRKWKKQLLAGVHLSKVGVKALGGHADTTESDQRAYIVYMGDIPRDFIGKLQLAHIKLLQKALGLSNEEATKRMICHYTKSLNGFAAMMTDEEAKNISGMKGIVYVTPNRKMDLYQLQVFLL